MADQQNFELAFNEYLNSEQPEHQLSPTCNEFQNSLSEQNRKNSGSMDMDEFLKWLAEDNNEAQGTVQQLNLQENVSEQPTFGNMSLDDFSVWAGLGEEPNYAQLAPPQQPPLQYQPPQTNIDATSEEAEKRQRRIIKHREAAARSRAKKQAHVVELEEKLIRLTKENKQRKRRLAWLENNPNFQYCEEEEATAKAPKSSKANEKLTELRRCFSSPY